MMVGGGARSRRSRVVVAVVVLVAGLALAIGGVVLAVVEVRDELTAPVATVPGTFERHLAPAGYVIYERTGTKTGGLITTTTNRYTTLAPADVVVTGPDGAVIPTRPMDFVTETLNRGKAIFTGALRFQAPAGGTYRFVFRGRVREVVVAREVGGVFRKAVPGIAMTIVGGVLTVTGMTLLIVALVRRGRPAVAVAGPVPPGLGATGAPPGWYPDPGGSGSRRYWDGARWTEHQA